MHNFEVKPRTFCFRKDFLFLLRDIFQFHRLLEKGLKIEERERNTYKDNIAISDSPAKFWM